MESSSIVSKFKGSRMVQGAGAPPERASRYTSGSSSGSGRQEEQQEGRQTVLPGQAATSQPAPEGTNEEATLEEARLELGYNTREGGGWGWDSWRR